MPTLGSNLVLLSISQAIVNAYCPLGNITKEYEDIKRAQNKSKG
jgi:hypothetical protein